MRCALYPWIRLRRDHPARITIPTPTALSFGVPRQLTRRQILGLSRWFLPSLCGQDPRRLALHPTSIVLGRGRSTDRQRRYQPQSVGIDLPLLHRALHETRITWTRQIRNLPARQLQIMAPARLSCLMVVSGQSLRVTSSVVLISVFRRKSIASLFQTPAAPLGHGTRLALHGRYQIR